MADAPAEQKAEALCNRGWVHYAAARVCGGNRGRTTSDRDLPKGLGCSRNLAATLLVVGRWEDALAAYDAALELASLENVDEMAKDVNDAVAKHGSLAGADEALARIESRRKALQDANDGPTALCPMG